MATAADILGIDATSVQVPRQFDPLNRDLWQRAFKLPVDERVSEYLRLCGKLGRNPFRHIHNATDNQAIVFQLRNLRRKLVKYIDEWGVLQRTMNERTPPVVMKVKKNGTGFEIHGSVLLRNINFLELKAEVEKRLFFQYNGPYKVGKWDWHKRVPGYPMEIGVSAANNFEAYIWYTITIDQTPYVNEILDQDPDKAFAEFVIRRIWLPIIYAQRHFTTRAKF